MPNSSKIVNLKATKKARRSFLLDYAAAAGEFELEFLSHDKVDPEAKASLTDIVAEISTKINSTYYYLQLCLPQPGNGVIIINGLAYPRHAKGEIAVTFYWCNKEEQTRRNEITRKLQPQCTELVAKKFRKSNPLKSYGQT